jgi:hypothetical protein
MQPITPAVAPPPLPRHLPVHLDGRLVGTGARASALHCPPQAYLQHYGCGVIPACMSDDYTCDVLHSRDIWC